MSQLQPNEPTERRVPDPQPPSKDVSASLEDFIRITFDKLPMRTKVLVSLFSALNGIAALTKNFDLPNHVGKIVRSEHNGPLIGESEEVNWLKGICDGISLLTNHS